MARKITDKQLYKLKNDELKAMFTQVTPYEFYRDVFPAGSLGVHGDLSVRKPNLIYRFACLYVIQWHPEAMLVASDDMLPVFTGLIEAAKKAADK